MTQVAADRTPLEIQALGLGLSVPVLAFGPVAGIAAIRGVAHRPPS